MAFDLNDYFSLVAKRVSSMTPSQSLTCLIRPTEKSFHSQFKSLSHPSKRVKVTFQSNPLMC